MDKRLNRSDYLLSLVFIFLLVCIAGAFFFGLQLGQQRTESKHAALLSAREDAAKKPGAYEQQHLVSYYHTIYTPYREFANRWFDKMKELELQAHTIDASSVFKDLSKAADDKYTALSKVATPDTSPLLGEAHQNILKSLKLFAESSKSFQSKANSLAPGDVLAEVDKDAYFREAKKFALQGEQQFYMSMVKWNETINPQVKGANLLGQTAYSKKEWDQMGINAKNAAVSSILLREVRYLPLYPQDMTVRIDEWFAGGQAQKMNLNDIQQIIDLLAETGSARKGDFVTRKEKWYGGDTLPQLPFFYENK
ncbi:hypothetical protein ACFFNY_28740 [Paenibacillus hodogayensis]|uniref:Uncharacterized protein n=1 Tax=Paenibacillus hodogayensis TaxID=279208 RepID=A0ABV5W4S9_9BACL